MKHLLLFSMAEVMANWQAWLIVIGVGLFFGFLTGLATRFRSLGLGFSCLLGIVGSILTIVYASGMLHFSKSDMINDLTAAAIGAILFTAIFNLLFGSNRGKDLTGWRA
jgi:uncharacterized membrane protein YeaQ/YmgE (transglycosylase-associated protein family)